MKNQLSRDRGRFGVPLLILAGLIGYVLIAGTTQTCPACAAVVGLFRQEDSAVSGPGESRENAAGISWQITGLDGEDLSSSAFEGKAVLVNFWATWCPPCRQEIPDLIALDKTYRESGLVILGISLDQNGEEAVRGFARKTGISYALAMANPAVFQAFGQIEFLPTTFFIDRDGDVVKQHRGYADKETLETQILELL